MILSRVSLYRVTEELNDHGEAKAGTPHGDPIGTFTLSVTFLDKTAEQNPTGIYRDGDALLQVPHSIAAKFAPPGLFFTVAPSRDLHRIMNVSRDSGSGFYEIHGRAGSPDPRKAS